VREGLKGLGKVRRMCGCEGDVEGGMWKEESGTGMDGALKRDDYCMRDGWREMVGGDRWLERDTLERDTSETDQKSDGHTALNSK